MLDLLQYGSACIYIYCIQSQFRIYCLDLSSLTLFNSKMDEWVFLRFIEMFVDAASDVLQEQKISSCILNCLHLG